MRARNQAGTFGLDDILIALAYIFSVGLSTVACIDADWYGLDRHTWDVKLQWYTGAALMGWIAQVLMLSSTCATKLSVLLFYCRMVKDIGRWVYAIWIALGFTICYFVGILLAYCLICQPLEAYWRSYDLIHPYTKPFQCVDGNALSICVGVLSVISDLYAVLLPMVVLHHYDLDVNMRQKFALRAIFASGMLVAGAGTARTYYLWKINHTYDTSWTGFNLYVWSLVECHLAIIVACAPSLRAFLRRYLRDTFKRTFDSASSYARRRRERGGGGGGAEKNTGSNSSGGTTNQSSALRYSGALSAADWKPKTMMNSDTLGGKGPQTWPIVETREDDGESSAGEEVALQHPPPMQPKIKSVEDYQAYNLQQLSRHAYKRSMDDPKRRHDAPENAVC
jgi:hypothetical protein